MSNQAASKWYVPKGWVSDYNRDEWAPEFRPYLPKGQRDYNDNALKMRTRVFTPVLGSSFLVTITIVKSRGTWPTLTAKLLSKARFFPTDDPNMLCSNNLSIVKDGGYPKGALAFKEKYTDVYFTIKYSVDADGTPKYTTASHWNKEVDGNRVTVQKAPAYAWKNH